MAKSICIQTNIESRLHHYRHLLGARLFDVQDVLIAWRIACFSAEPHHIHHDVMDVRFCWGHFGLYRKPRKISATRFIFTSLCEIWQLPLCMAHEQLQCYYVGFTKWGHLMRLTWIVRWSQPPIAPTSVLACLFIPSIFSLLLFASSNLNSSCFLLVIGTCWDWHFLNSVERLWGSGRLPMAVRIHTDRQMNRFE